MLFKVVEVIDGDTFRVSGRWNFNGQIGDLVRPTGYDTPEEGQRGYNEAKEKLKRLILNKVVELRNPVNIDHGRLVCDVYLGNKNIADFFPKYQ